MYWITVVLAALFLNSPAQASFENEYSARLERVRLSEKIILDVFAEHGLYYRSIEQFTQHVIDDALKNGVSLPVDFSAPGLFSEDELVRKEAHIQLALEKPGPADKNKGEITRGNPSQDLAMGKTAREIGKFVVKTVTSTIESEAALKAYEALKDREVKPMERGSIPTSERGGYMDSAGGARNGGKN